ARRCAVRAGTDHGDCRLLRREQHGAASNRRSHHRARARVRADPDAPRVAGRGFGPGRRYTSPTHSRGTGMRTSHMVSAAVVGLTVAFTLGTGMAQSQGNPELGFTD